MIKDFTPRLYQETILATCAGKNTLVVLPTGLGKTNIFLMLAALRLRSYPNSKILFIGPTRPLIDQYLAVFQKHFQMPPEKMAVFTGFVAPEKRAELWKGCQIIFSTPQGLENDILSGKLDLSEVSLLGVDEAHRAVKDYAYVWIAKQYNKTAKYPRIIGLTASPGSDIETIDEVCRNLFIEEIEVRNLDDPDVKPYVKEIELEWVKVVLPERFTEVRKYLIDCVESKLKDIGREYPSAAKMSKKDLLQLQATLHAQLARGEKDFETLKAVSLLAEAMKVQHALELLETQGITALHKYFEKLFSESATSKTKAVKNLVRDLNFRTAMVKTDKLFSEDIEHPKMRELAKIIEREALASPSVKIIVFTQFRDSATKISEELAKIKDVLPKVFVGQMKKGETGMSQKVQKQVLDDFREGKFNVLISTSIGEEGLDVPRVDLVIFYEPIPSAIRFIQRRGRTGRQEKGRVIVLVTRNTRDEAYSWSASRKEKKMYSLLETVRKRLVKAPRAQPSLSSYVKEGLVIITDYREQKNNAVKELIDLGIEVKIEKLEVADFLCSSSVGVEFKTSEDFVNSIIDGRLLSQAADLKRSFAKPLLIIESPNEVFSMRNVHPNAIRGALAAIAVDFGIPILQTHSSKETAAMLQAIAKREQSRESADFEIRAERKPLTLQEQQEFIISSLPGIGISLAKPLLSEFGSVKGVINASGEELQKVPLIGEKKSEEIKRVVDGKY